MVEGPYDTYIDFGLDDEAAPFASSSDSQTLPPFLVEILAALNSEPPSFQMEETDANALTFPSPPAAPSTSYPQTISPSHYPFPTPFNSLSEHHPWTCVRPSDTIRVHGSLPAPPAPSAPPVLSVPPAFFVLPALPPPNPYAYVPPAICHHTPTKRLQEQIEGPSCREQSSSRKRPRRAPPCTSGPDVGHVSNTIDDTLPIQEAIVEAAPVGPGAVPSMIWGVVPGPESGKVAGSSTVDIENVPVPRKSRKRAPKGKTQSDGPAPSKNRHKKTALADVPEVLNTPITPPSGAQFIEYGPLPAAAAIEAPALISTSYPELTPEFYEELYNIASEIAQELKQTSGTDSTSTCPNVPGPSTTTHDVRENNPGPPLATTKGKRRRPQSPTNKPPKKRQRTDNPTKRVDTSTDPETSEKPFGCPFLTDDPPCLTRFSRETDIRRHVRSKHLGCEVFCTHEVHRGAPARVVREDGVFRHLGFNTCIGREERDELAERMGGAPDPVTGRWPTRVMRAVSGDYTLCRMPCYHTRRFWRGVGHLPGWTPDKLERWFAKYGKVKRCSCGLCQNISEAELRGEVKVAILDEEQVGDTHPSATARPTAGPGSSGTLAPAASPPESLDVAAIADHAEWDDDKLPPEEEEGVDEDIPEPPLALVADTVAVATQDSDNDASITHLSEGVEGTPPELQAVFEILSGLPDGDLESLLRRSDGSQSENDRTPDGKADS